MKKRLLSILMACVMLVGVLPLAAGAQTIAISYITVVNIDEPSAGTKPDLTGMCAYTNDKTTENANLTVEKIEWEGVFDSQDRFISGQTYDLTVTIGFKSGSTSYFSSSLIGTVGKVNQQTTINGDAAKVLSADKKSAQLRFTYILDDQTTSSSTSTTTSSAIGYITVVNIDEPSAGAKPDLTGMCAYTNNANKENGSLEVKNIEWEGVFDSQDRFVAGETYDLTVTVGMKSGVNGKFSQKLMSSVGTVNDRTTINGDAAKVLSASETTVKLRFTYILESQKEYIKTVAVNNLTEPVVGAYPDLTVTPTGENAAKFEVTEVEWVGVFDSKDCFITGQPYTVNIKLAIKDGVNAGFSSYLTAGTTKGNATINGDAATVTRNGTSNLTISYTWGPAQAESGTAYASTQKVLIDGKAVTLQAYALKDANGNPTNYVKLRDIAYVLNGSTAQFQVGWDGNVNILTKQSYTANGSEMKTPFSGDRYYNTPTAATKINGQTVDLAAIALYDDAGGGYTYYQLRDLGRTLGFNVSWSAELGIYIETDKPYSDAN